MTLFPWDATDTYCDQCKENRKNYPHYKFMKKSI